MIKLILRKSLLSNKSEFAFFVRWLRSAHFFISEQMICVQFIEII